jgi:aminoglycoside phosphotransferase family enzyme/predicted kinase
MSTELLINNLQNSTLYNYPITRFQVIETHISWVILTGQYAYKIKKPVDFQFLNYSTLEKREYYCRKELSLNKIMAPEIYQEVVGITGSEESPRLNGDGPVIEYALKMIEFPQQALFDYLLINREIHPNFIDELGKKIAHFHKQASSADKDSRFGTPEQVFAPIKQNFDQIRPLLKNKADLDQLSTLEQVATQHYQILKSLLQRRKDQGFIRECHGDLHLKNIVLLHQKPVIFDCIEFNEDFRWTDTIADVGFLAMDFHDNQRPDYAYRFVNTYMAYSGDYSGLPLLNFYMAYRAMVRAKVSLFRLTQTGLSEDEIKATHDKYRSCTNLIEHINQPKKQAIIITHGLVGSGKSTWAKRIVDHYGAIQIRADIERKRIYGLDPENTSHSPLNSHLYSNEANEKTTARMEELVREVLQAGYPVIVDATFIKKKQRDQVRQLASELDVPFAIIECQAPMDSLMSHITNRKEKKSDPSEASLEVLAWQETAIEHLTPEEQQYCITVEVTKSVNPDDVFNQLDKILGLY